ncbi:hypothetical protein XENTR_v10009760 [Xenopus tropicalis]|nr:hypothetical protein XENTR_v10009760 [Xenopus tropicalis]
MLPLPAFYYIIRIPYLPFRKPPRAPLPHSNILPSNQVGSARWHNFTCILKPHFKMCILNPQSVGHPRNILVCHLDMIPL